jgi:hypothetical protein
VVRQLIGYDRFEGEKSYRQLAEVYRATRLYVNFFQPSMKLSVKTRKGSSLYRKYDQAQTPFQRLGAAQILTAEAKNRLEEVARALDPVQLLAQLQTLQNALWKQALLPAKAFEPVGVVATTPTNAVKFDVKSCVGANSRIISGDGELTLQPLEIALDLTRGKRHYHRSQKSAVPRSYRTRIDPFLEVNDELKSWLREEPGGTITSLFQKLQRKYPGKFPAVQVRTLQRRMKEWRAKMIIEFDDDWLQEDLAIQEILPRPLRASEMTLNEPSQV